jgi:hypothetical protein
MRRGGEVEMWRCGEVSIGLCVERIRTSEVEERHQELLGRRLECVILLELVQLRGRGREGRQEGGERRDERESAPGCREEK